MRGAAVRGAGAGARYSRSCAVVAFARASLARSASGLREADLRGRDRALGHQHHAGRSGLPPGSGTPDQGAKVFATKCALCHGPEAKGGTNAALVGGAPLTSGIDTPKTIANFWPYATTLFDFTRRAMPWQQPRTLTNDEVYAVTAYILALNKIIGPNDVMNAATLPKVRMPNRDGFIVRFPEKMP